MKPISVGFSNRTRLFYLFETITPAMQQVLDNIKSITEIDNPFSTLHLHGKTMELLTMFLEKLEKRSEVKSLANLNLMMLNQYSVFVARFFKVSVMYRVFPNWRVKPI